ncbi:MAG: Glycosyl transferase group 1 [candidate division TM6 bacterium GW2011_GWF2_37_49]|nr:MAG: Glycosyl transferase group 1 [candidate division TM6 bacterium GW2011_GWF2_37_49]
MNKKKILYIHHGKGLGGAPLSLLYLIQALDKTKYEPEVLFLHDSEVVNLYIENGIKISGIVNLHDFSHTKIWWFKWYHIPHFWRSCKDTIKTIHSAAYQWLDKIKPDIVHLNTSSLIAWGKVAHRKNIPVVWHIREPLAAGYFGLRKNLIRHCVNKYSSAIVPICKHDAKPWINSHKVRVIYNAVDPHKFNFELSESKFLEQHRLDSISPKILFLGGLSHEKGTDVILKAFKLVVQNLPHAKLLIAGYFDPNLKTTSWITKLSPSHKFKKDALKIYNELKHNIVLLGPTQNIPAAMAASKVVVFPAKFGHFARPVIEAGFMKKPVIASNFAPLDELIKDTHEENSGFLIDPKNITLWADKLLLLLTDDNLNKKMGEEGYKFCTAKFDLKNQIQIIEQIYSNI